MASNIKDFLKGARTKHTVGQVNSYNFDTIINGAICKEDLDNFTMGEIEYAKGTTESGAEEVEAYVKKATAETEAYNAVLLVTPEVRLNTGDFKELLCDFYNAKGERATCAILAPNFTFETSAFDATDVASTPAVGQYAEWDGVGGKFKLKSAPGGTEKKLFRVVEVTTDVNYSIDDEPMVMLTVLK